MIHEKAATGFTRAVEAYERGRPDYPRAAVEHLCEVLGIELGATVIDLGAGTGKLTRQLVSTGAKIIAVEPLAAMREKLADHLPEIDLYEGTAEAIPLPDASADAVTVAQAFHWFDGPRALAELARVLAPHGKLGLIWNVRDERVDWVRALGALFEVHERGEPRFRDGRWRLAFASSAFVPLEERVFEHVQLASPETIVDRVVSISFVAALPEPEREAVAEAVRALLGSHPDTRGRDQLALPYRTHVYTTALRSI
jgi:SAM-dependent methyltransferase